MDIKNITQTDLVIFFANHNHIYDSDCDEDFGCSCGHKSYDEIDIGHEEHLAIEFVKHFNE